VADQRIILEFIGDPTGLKPAFDAMKAMGQLTKEQEAAFNAANAAFASRHGAAVQAEKDQKKLTEEVKKTDTEMDDLVNSTKQLPKAIKDGATATGGLNSGLSKVGNTVSSLGKQIASAFGFAGAIFTVINTIKQAFTVTAEFGSQMATVQAVLGGTKSEMAALTKNALDLGAATKFSATEVGKLQEEFAKLGFTAPEIMNVTKATLLLAEATGTTLEEAASVAGTTIKGFGLATTETTRVTDVMAGALNRTALDMTSFSEAMNYVAPIARSAGISIETTTALLGKLADVGIKGSMGGTALKNLLGKLADGSSDLAKAAGGAVKNSDDLFRAFDNLAKKNIDLSTALEITDERAAAAFLTLVKDVPALKELDTALHNVTGETQAMADVMRDTLTGDIDKFSSAWEGLLLQLGSTVSWRAAVQGVTSLMDAVSLGIRKIQGATSELIAEEKLYERAVNLAGQMAQKRVNTIKAVVDESRQEAAYVALVAKEQENLTAQLATQSREEERLAALKEQMIFAEQSYNLVSQKAISAEIERTELALQVSNKKVGSSQAAMAIYEAELKLLVDLRTENAKNLEADKKAAAEKLKAAQAADTAARGEVGSIKYLTWELGELDKKLKSSVAGGMAFKAWNEQARVKAKELAEAVALLNNAITTLTVTKPVIEFELKFGQSTDSLDVALANVKTMVDAEKLIIWETVSSKEERDAALEMLDIRHLEMKLNYTKAAGEDTVSLETELAAKRAGITDEMYAAMFASATNYADGAKTKLGKFFEEFQAEINEAAAAFSASFEGMTSLQQTHLNLQQAALDRSFNAGLISRETYDRRRRELMRRQADLEKQQALFQAIIQTALAVVTALTAGPGAGQILAGVTAALGAVQIGIIAASPAFAKGTKKAPRGFKWVGEEGAELIYDDGGYPIITNKESQQIASDPMGIASQMIMKKYDIPTMSGVNWGGMQVRSEHTSKLVERSNGFDYERLANVFGERFGFTDSNMVRAIDGLKRTTHRGNLYLAEVIKENRTPKRGGYV
jgi:TP901 family phage tail tape measure protein